VGGGYKGAAGSERAREEISSKRVLEMFKNFFAR
jgi:hypothetical protein